MATPAEEAEIERGLEKFGMDQATADGATGNEGPTNTVVWDYRHGAGHAGPNVEDGDLPTPVSVPCRYPDHRESDWINDAGNPVCGVCHPRADKAAA